MNDGTAVAIKKVGPVNVFQEFTEFSRKEIKDLEKKFKEFCCQGTQKIGLEELKVAFFLIRSKLCSLPVHDGKAGGAPEPLQPEGDDQGGGRGPRQRARLQGVPAHLPVRHAGHPLHPLQEALCGGVRGEGGG